MAVCVSRSSRSEGTDVPIHYDNTSHPLPQSTLDKKGHVDDAHTLPTHPKLEYMPQNRTRHRGVHDGIQLLPLGIVIEDDRTKFLPVERPIRKDDFRAKGGRYLRERTGSRGDSFACENIGVDDRNARGAQESRHGRLACGYATCKTNDCNRMSANVSCRSAKNESLPSIVVVESQEGCEFTFDYVLNALVVRLQALCSSYHPICSKLFS